MDVKRPNYTVTFISLLAAVAVSAWATGAGPCHAAEPFYRGKTVKIIVTTRAGGGYDLIARTAARHLPKFVQGSPRTIVQNMPGAGSVIGANYIYNVASGDSTVVGAVGNQVAFAPLLGIKEAKFDPDKFNWLGSPTSEVGLLIVWHKAPVNTIEDSKKREVIVATSGGGSTSAFYARVINDVFGTKLKILEGYRGMSGAFLAMERGEVDGFPSAFWSSLKATKPDWVRDKKVKYILQYGNREPHPDLPDVPVARDLANTEDDKRLLDVAMAPLNMGRPFLMPPGVPPEHVRIMRAALMETFQDKTFVDEARKQNLEMGGAMSGAEIERIIEDTYAAPQQVIDRLVRLYSIGRRAKKKK